jgi:hypothetical protein
MYVMAIPVIQYASDLHLEFYANVPRDADFFRRLVIPAPNANILVLAGDIGHAEAPITEKFLEWCCSNWKYVIWVYGNHEYYNKKSCEKWRCVKPYTMAEKEQVGLDLQERLSNLRVLNTQSVVFPEFPDYVFIGATLWTYITEEEMVNLGYHFSDFKYISVEHTVAEGYKPFTPSHWAELNDRDTMYILDMLAHHTLVGPPKKCIVITHHLPTFEMILDKYKYDNFNYGFASDYNYILDKPQIVAWICGHSHGQKQIARGPCYLNARGYPNESSQQTYNPSKCIESLAPKPVRPWQEILDESGLEFV